MLINRVGSIALIFLFVLCGTGCGTTRQETGSQEVLSPSVESAVFPPHGGQKIKANVVRFDIDKVTLEKFPELKAKRVGFGLCNRIVETLYESGCFELVEEKEEIKKRIQEEWLNRAVFGDSIEEPTGFAPAEFLIYADVYDFGVRDTSSVSGLSKKEGSETWVTIQVRAVFCSNGEYVPASGTGQCLVQKQGSIWGGQGEDFDASSVGKASDAAVRNALLQLVERLKKRGYFL